jgi:hypothetical protein
MNIITTGATGTGIGTGMELTAIIANKIECNLLYASLARGGLEGGFN